MIKTVIFDLDGTLTNPLKSFTACLRHAFSSLGIPMLTEEQVKTWIGPPIYNSLKNHLGLDDETAQSVVELYRSYYVTNGLGGNDIYNGVKQMLAQLKQMGFSIALATAKLETFATQILHDHDIYKYFDVISGATPNTARIEKVDVLRRALTLLNAENEQCIMVGDRLYDVEGASALGIDTIGVLYGYGTAEELLSHGAKYLAETPTEVVEIVKNIK